MRTFLFTSLFLLLQAFTFAQQPALLEAEALKGFDDLSEPRQKLLNIAIETGTKMQGLPYKFGGNGPEDGGFDCSGAMKYILDKMGLEAPRTSSAQYLWVKDKGEIHEVGKEVRDLEHESFDAIKPGDLVFWSGTYVPTDTRKTKVTHVAMFLGHEKEDGRAVMINATSGRSYRGKKGDGFGVFDFRVPSENSKSRLIAYGSPPGLTDLETDTETAEMDSKDTEDNAEPTKEGTESTEETCETTEKETATTEPDSEEEESKSSPEDKDKKPDLEGENSESGDSDSEETLGEEKETGSGEDDETPADEETP